MKAKLAFLVVFLGIGGAISYSQVTGEKTDAVIVEEPQVAARTADGEEIEVEQYFYAVESHDGILVPLVFVAETITDEDKEQLISLCETVFSQMNADELDKGAEMVMLHANRNREKPVWVEVIRMSQ